MMGGWGAGAEFWTDTHVIDLTGSEHKSWDIAIPFDEVSKKFMPFVTQSYAGWLSLPFDDYKTPRGMNTKEQWIGVKNVIVEILESGHDVLVACEGGHGRSGLFCSIVGYMLNIEKDKTWENPIEKLRTIHCELALDTHEQELFVFNILGLDNKVLTPSISRVKEYAGETCPICGKNTYFLREQGMCMPCKVAYEDTAPEKDHILAKDIGVMNLGHKCTDKKCIGIWKASKCGHITHNMVVNDGLCKICFDAEFSGKKLFDKLPEFGKCAICYKESEYAEVFGICYECADKVKSSSTASWIHDSLTDAYTDIPHPCSDVCQGIVIADACGHVVHDNHIVNGLCDQCQNVRTTLDRVGVEDEREDR